jgi:hypothetical protein
VTSAGQHAFWSGSGGALARLTGASLLRGLRGQHSGETLFQLEKGPTVQTGQGAHPSIQQQRFLNRNHAAFLHSRFPLRYYQSALLITREDR